MLWFIGVGSYWAFDVKDNGCIGAFCCTLELVEPAHAGQWMANAKNVLLSSAVSLSVLVFVHIKQLMLKTMAALLCFVVH